VSAVTQIAKQLLEGAVRPLWVRGEVTDFKAHRSGHWYFSLRDQTSQIRCVVWSSDQRRMPAPPDDGMEVLAFGQVTLYPVRGDLQLRITALEARGDGLGRKALDRAVRALERDGLLDQSRKRRLPRFPRCLAVITSPDGAALHDIIVVARRRAPSLRIVLVAARVQGDGAREEICAALARVRRWGKADVVIVGRGGGAKEDLSAFNDERVARALAACPVPTISAVGHEIDVTLCDLVADHRAPTPSAAAEAAVPRHATEEERLRGLAGVLTGAVRRRLGMAATRLTRAATATRRNAVRLTERRQSQLDTLAGRLDALSPLGTLARGFAVARGADGRTLSRVAAFAPGTSFDLLVQDGKVRALTQEIQPAPAQGSTETKTPEQRPPAERERRQ
jgi:exodeoxyribonuclease VII large subunit